MTNRSPGRGPRARLRSWRSSHASSCSITLRLGFIAAQGYWAGVVSEFAREPEPLSAAEPKVDEALAVAHGLKPDEYARLVALIGRDPTFTELGVVSAMWNEHCSYKSSRLHLRKLPTKGPHVIHGPGENAGRDRHRRRRRLRVQDGEPQSSLVHRALSGRRDRGRRHPARRVHNGGKAHRLPRFPPLRRARSCPNPPPRGRGHRRDRRLRQFVRRADGRRLDRLP